MSSWKRLLSPKVQRLITFSILTAIKRFSRVTYVMKVCGQQSERLGDGMSNQIPGYGSNVYYNQPKARGLKVRNAYLCLLCLYAKLLEIKATGF